MRFDILAIGSRGDVQPCIALGLGLKSAGHRVRIVTLGGFEDLVTSRGLDHLAIAASPRELASTEAGRDWVKQRGSAAGFLRGFIRLAESLIEAGIANYWRQCRDVEVLAASGMGFLIGAHIAEALRIPMVRVQLSPFAHTRYDWTGRKNLLTAIRGDWTAFLHSVFRTIIWSKLRGRANHARQSVLSLPALPLMDPFQPMDRMRLPLLDAYSPHVVPRPPDWGDWIHVTGYWFLDEPLGWSAPADLADFLSSGAPPVFVGFGSTPFPNPEASTNLIVRALQRAGQRGLVVTDGSGLATGRLTDDILSVNFVPHQWLFSRVCAAVHHGGAGVTGAALRAGIPSATVPVFADQPFWSDRVFRLGAGPKPIPAKRLTEVLLAGAIRATAGTEMRQRAATLGKQIRGEDGITHAVEVIQQHLGGVA